MATLTVHVPAGITTQPASQGVVLGQGASFSVVAGGTAPFSYQWIFNGNSLPGATSSTLTLTSVQTNEGGNYSVLVGNAYGSVTSSNATLAVYVPPTITTQPQNQSVGQGTNASFPVVASGSTPLSYQWSFNGAALSGATTSTLTITNAQTTNAGSYTVAVTNSWGSISSAVAVLTVYVPPTITTQPLSQAVVQGHVASFSVGAIGTANLNYQWYCNGSSLGGGATSSTLMLNAVGTNNAGSYTVVVTNTWSTVTSAVATLTVYVPPTMNPQPQNQAVVQGQTASFSIGANGTVPFSYQWNQNGAAVPGATNAALTLTNVQTTQAGSYTVAVTNNGGS
jgi:uncharacterized protein YpmS